MKEIGQWMKGLSVLTLGLVLGLSAMTGVADDTDIYRNTGAGLPPGSEPMVMFSLDYRPNLGSAACQNAGECQQLIDEGYLAATGPYTFFDVLRAALRKVMEPLTGVRVGLMLNHDNSNGLNSSNGGYIAMGFEMFDAADSNGAKEKFHSILAAIPTPGGNVSHSFQGKELYFELFRYLTGQGVYNAENGWTDYGTDNTENLDIDGVGLVDLYNTGTSVPVSYSWDGSITRANDRTYISPYATSTECVDTYAVNFMFFASNQENDSDSAIRDTVANGGFGAQQPDFDDVIRYMHDADLANGVYGTAPNLANTQNVTSYFLVDPVFVNQTSIGYAQAGGTGFPLELTNDPEQLVRTLENLFVQILSVSTTFVAASVPVNVFNRAEIVDNVFLALFQVDPDNKPYWPGNVKKLTLQTLDNTTYLADALNNPAIASDGRIRFDALTYWTDPQTLPPADPALNEVDGRDGRVVSRGGAGQQVPGYVPEDWPGLINAEGLRQVYYDFYDVTGGRLVPLDSTTAVRDDLESELVPSPPSTWGPTTISNVALALVQYLRGFDNADEDGDGVIGEARNWIFGDPLHSRPLPINYGARAGYTTANPAIYLAVGGNDGYLHFVRNTTTVGAQSGEEAWAFFPRAVAGKVAALAYNSVGTPHPYTVDSSPVAYLQDTNANGTIDLGEKAYVYFGMRRGGKAYYALDVSDPEAPQLLWKIEKGLPGSDFAELGYTFSEPRVGMVNIGNGPQAVLVFAGGYDMNKDLRTGIGTDDAEGNAIFVVDAETGALIWKAHGGSGGSTSTEFVHSQLVDSIPSTVTAVDSDGDRLLDRIVVGDTGGNVWRADIHGQNTANWKLTLLASLGRHAVGSTTKADDRRFFHRPDLVLTKDDAGPFDAVIVGSGDRPDPLDQGGIASNYLYMIKDRNVLPGSGTDIQIDHADLGDVTDNCLQLGSCVTPPNLAYGWKLLMADQGEKILATPITIGGTIFFTSYIPGGINAANPCAPAEGNGRLWAVNLQNAGSVINYDTATDQDGGLDVGTTASDRSTMLGSTGIPAEVVSIPPDRILRPDLQVDNLDITLRWRTFWYTEEDSDL